MKRLIDHSRFYFWADDSLTLEAPIHDDLRVSCCRGLTMRQHLSYLEQSVLNSPVVHLAVGKLDKSDVPFVVGSLAGAHRWCAKQVGGDGDTCLLCGLPAQGRDHIWWECSATERVREEWGDQMAWVRVIIPN